MGCHEEFDSRRFLTCPVLFQNAPNSRRVRRVMDCLKNQVELRIVRKIRKRDNWVGFGFNFWPCEFDLTCRISCREPQRRWSETKSYFWLLCFGFSACKRYL